MLNIVNQLFKIYFRVNKLHLCKPLIRAIEQSSLKDRYPKSQEVTYKYYVGRKHMFDNNFKAAERTETINIVRTLIDFNKELFELSWEDLHSLYVRMNEDVPEAMDYLLRRRALLNGDE